MERLPCISVSISLATTFLIRAGTVDSVHVVSQHRRLFPTFVVPTGVGTYGPGSHDPYGLPTLPSYSRGRTSDGPHSGSLRERHRPQCVLRQKGPSLRLVVKPSPVPYNDPLVREDSGHLCRFSFFLPPPFSPPPFFPFGVH